MIRICPLDNNLLFTTKDAAIAYGITCASAHVLCSRYAKNGLFIRLKKNCYTSRLKWQTLPTPDILQIANTLQVPSYVSLTTALSFYEVTTQIQQGFIESIGQKRSVQFDVQSLSFRFYKMAKNLYFDFVKTGGLFIATKEKAFLDCAYLCSFGKYTFDINALDLKKLNRTRLKILSKKFPKRTQNMVRTLCKI